MKLNLIQRICEKSGGPHTCMWPPFEVIFIFKEGW